VESLVVMFEAAKVTCHLSSLVPYLVPRGVGTFGTHSHGGELVDATPTYHNLI
jgi:hypothetical protein